MAKEFDVYLNKRLTECDIIVYSIPLRDGLTAFERLILESCIESYTLQKFIAVNTKSELVSHIDEMLKICNERLAESVEIATSAEFEVQYALSPKASAIEVDSRNLDLLAISFADLNHAIEVSSSPLRGLIMKVLHPAHTGIDISSDVYDTLKISVEQASPFVIPNSTLVGTNKQSFIVAEPSVVPVSHMTDLLYRVYDTVSSAIQITAAALETELHFSLGSGFNTIEISSMLMSEQITKHEVVNDVVLILSEVIESLTVFANPELSPILLTAEADAILRRHRLVGEMDAYTLSVYDNDMTLDDVDYVIL